MNVQLHRRTLRLIGLTMALGLVAAACGSSDATDAQSVTTAADASSSGEAMSDVEAISDDEAMDDPDHSGDLMEDDAMEDEDAMEDGGSTSPILDVSFTDVDGVAFTLADFVGTPVLVETFATWCPNCRAQLQSNQEAAAQAGDDAVFVALSIETDIDVAEVVAYAEENGFTDIRFGVLSPDGLAAFNDEFGGTAINPPSTPHWVIDASGSASDLKTGSESAEAILSALGLA